MHDLLNRIKIIKKYIYIYVLKIKTNCIVEPL